MLKRSTSFVFALAVVVAAVGIFACDTPVYRYAMYRWIPAPYEIYCFHRGPLSPGGKELETKAAALAADVKLSANLVFIPIDLEKDPELKTVPPDVAGIWKKEESKEAETCLVVNPLGYPVYRGALTAASLAELVDSPARKKLGEALAKGHASVFILLANDDADASGKAEKLLAELAADVRAGKIDLYIAPENAGPKSERSDRPDEKSGDRLPVPRGGGKKTADEASEKKEPGEAKPGKPPAEIGVLVIRRNDPAEAWVVRQLLAVESDLHELDQPMIFPAFGRGRAMPPLVGKGIKRINLEEALHYVTGACVCTVRDQNPGVDLLTRFDWLTAAEKMAAQHGSEEGARFALRDLQLFSEQPKSAPTAPKAEEKAPATEKQTEPDSKSLRQTKPRTKPYDPPKASDLAPPPPEQIIVPSDPPAVPPAPETTTHDLLTWLGGGLAIAIVALAAATWWMLRGNP